MLRTEIHENVAISKFHRDVIKSFALANAKKTNTHDYLKCVMREKV